MQKLRPKTGKSCAVSGIQSGAGAIRDRRCIKSARRTADKICAARSMDPFLRFGMRPSRTLAATLHPRSHRILSLTTAKNDLSVGPFSEKWRCKCARPRSRRVPSFLKAQFAKYTIVFEFVLLRCSRVCVRPSNVWFWHVQEPT